MQFGVGERVSRRRPWAHTDPSGLARACEALAAGQAVIVANPAPMAYGIVATRASTINILKRRKDDRNVAVSLHAASQWERVALSIDLPGDVLAAVAVLLQRRLSVLMPLRPAMPPPRWVVPAVRDGYLAVFNGYWSVTARLWQQFPRLYGSSANLTGDPPAGSAAQAEAVFGPDHPIVDADALTGPPGPRWSSTMVRINRDAQLELHRTGAQDRESGLAPEDFVRALAARVGLGTHVDRERSPNPE